jgi:formiminotetrahydrofolate cyclodeaminase
LPKETEEEKSERASQIQLALRGAADVPLETARRSLEVLTLLRELADIGIASALSDAAVGAQLAQTAVKGACYNVGANLNSLADREAAEKLRKQVSRLVDGAKTIADEVDSKMKS